MALSLFASISPSDGECRVASNRGGTIEAMVDLLPNRAQARKLVVSVAVFWTAWGVFVLTAAAFPAVAVVAFLIGMPFLFRFYLTLYRVWEPESGESAWSMMFRPRFSRRRMRVGLHIFDVLKPRWIRHTLRETGWNAAVVGCGLCALLVADLVLLFTVLSNASGT